MNIIDIVIIGFIGVFALTGYFRGLINTLFNMISFVLSVALTYFLFPYVSRFIMLRTGLYQKITDKINVKFNLDTLIKSSSTKNEQLDVIQSLGVPKGTKEMLINNNNADVLKLMDAGSFKEYISKSLATLAINVIAFIVLFILISIILTILAKVLNLITEVSNLNQANRIAGAGLGAIMGLLFVFIGLAVITYILATKNQANLLVQIDQSLLGRLLYNNNPIIDFLSNDIENNHFWKILTSFKKV